MGIFTKQRTAHPAAAAPAKSPPPAVTEEQKQAALARSQQVYASLGRIVTVMMRSPRYRGMSLDYIESLAAPAIGTGQFAVANAHDNERGTLEPVALVLWTSVSPAVEKRLSKLGNKPMTLSRNDWGSGDIPWLVALVGDQRLAGPMLANLQQKNFGGRPLKARIKEKNKVVVREVSAATLLPEHLAL